MSSFSIVERVPDQLGYHCGYCGSEDTAKAQGMWAHSMSTINYQRLIDRGWRRSGKYVYHPMMKVTCCPQYTIRCHALDYKISKSKRKVLAKMRQFLMTEGDDEKEQWKAKQASKPPEEKRKGKKEPAAKKDDADEETRLKLEEEKITEASSAEEMVPEPSTVEPSPEPKEPLPAPVQTEEAPSASNVEEPPSNPKKTVRKGAGPDPSKPLCKKAKVLRQEMKKKKEMSKGAGEPAEPTTTSKQKAQTPLKDLIPHLSPSPDFKRKLEIRLIRANVDDKEFAKSRAESYDVYQRYQVTIHKDQPSECTEKQWIRFLVDCPLQFDRTGPGPGFGNFHQQYLLDGKIIAVGVIDILPVSTSSVYLYYDPDYGFLSLGTYSALSELAYTQALHAERPELEHYYMGFYIHSCPKMMYKNKYPPTEILCPETYTWVPMELCLPVLDKSEYSRLNVLNGGSPDDVDKDRGDDFDMNELAVIYRRNLLTYYKYVRWKYINIKFPEQNPSYVNERAAARQQEVMERELIGLKEYVSLVGTECAKGMHLYRSIDDD